MAKNWTTENIPDQSSKTIIVTGPTSGIGLITAKELAAAGAKVIMAARNPEKTAKAIETITSEVENADLDFIQLDVASLKSVKAFAKAVKSKYSKLDTLINNAGIMLCPYSTTEDGFEIQMGTNHLGHFALTALLMPELLKADQPRVVAVSSKAAYQGNLKLKDLMWEDRKYRPMYAYADSKLANLCFIYELNARAKKAGVKLTAAAAHPGWAATELQRHSGPSQIANHLFAAPTEMGALPTLRAATDPGVKPDEFYGPSKLFGWRGYPEANQPRPRSYKKFVASELWVKSESLTGIEYKF